MILWCQRITTLSLGCTIQGFHDPDIAVLNRAVPTPSTSDVPLALQRLSSIKATALVGDVKSALTQGLRNQREEFLVAPTTLWW